MALEYAIAHPDRLLALVLRDTWAYGLRGTLNVLKNILISDRIKPDGDRQVRVWGGNVRDNEDFAEAFAEIADIYKPKDGTKGSSSAPNDAFKWHYDTHNFAFSYNQPRFDVRSRLKEITAPTLVATGRHDVIVSYEYGEEISQNIPQSELVIFENSGHSPPSDEPERFRQTVSQFLYKWVL